MAQMNFFEHQDIARRNTRLLIILFLVAVVLLVVLTGAAVAVFAGGLGGSSGNANSGYNTGFVFHWDIILASCGVVLSGISLAVLYKWAVLRPGGKVVAEKLGGRRLEPSSTDPIERKVLNVVEEMAIAANMPVPPVYLLENEPGINAFAAGYSPKDAVIGITRGCAEQLTRSQLQGVVAHEIAHILNGDMRMNIRIMAVLNGILFISHAGYLILRTTALSGGRRRSNDNSKNLLPFLGIALLIIGAIGVFFGNIIKAAVSRQREYLADASAVQFTREPETIGGALQQIGALQAGSQIENQNASEASHLFFGQAISKWASIFSTHPPLESRIKRVLPHWDGTFKANTAAQLANTNGTPEPTSKPAAGQMSKERFAQLAILASLPEQTRTEARDQIGSEALTLALIFSDDAAVRNKQQALVVQAHGPEFAQRVTQNYANIQNLSTEQRLPLVELAMPAIKSLTAVDKKLLLSTLQQLKEVDQQVSLYEWCLTQLVERYIHADLKPNQRVAGVRMKAQTDAELSLSILAAYGHENQQEADAAFNAAAKVYGTALQPIRSQPLSFGDLADALNRIDRWDVRHKERLVNAWVQCVNMDGEITPTERKLLYTLATCISQPLPELPDSL
ncbi:M48 family metallopeptidase [Aliidiomarina quisquiliarum]|uniref:M48 family metallopeptidase n=1 Tax=Aliidiomarina quisquiliarum TaxID=2938947 RepID=UPI00208FA90C|nr:M48 family metallopeptidase [Aliidiomarina quisquiliarum]MCO4321061.1 M48 family metallopeptidase [Aliidiomarina quisquiliarum]